MEEDEVEKGENQKGRIFIRLRLVAIKVNLQEYFEVEERKIGRREKDVDNLCNLKQHI